MVLKDENKKNETWLHFSRVRQALEQTLPYLITDNIRKHEDYLGHCIVNESAVSWADLTVDIMSRTKGKEVKNTGTLNFHIYFVYLQAFNDLAYFNVYIFGYSFFSVISQNYENRGSFSFWLWHFFPTISKLLLM